MDDVNRQILTQAERLAPRLVAARQELHRHPELAYQEVWTTERLRTWLSEAGIAILPLNLPTGVVAEVRGARPGPTVALRADIDALPVQEETGLPYASEIPGRMHACGHDFHMAAVLGAAWILQALRHHLTGKVRILFQPAEEEASGARTLIAAGALEGVQAIFGMHNKPDLPPGHVGIKAGPLMAATDTISITVEGKGGHAAIPDAAQDPVVAAAAIVMALQTVVSRNVSPLDSAVVTIGSFQAGTTHNVIPPSATLMGTVRTFTPAVRERVRERIHRIVTDVAAAYGTVGKLSWLEGTPAVDNSPAMAELMRRAAAKVGLTVVEAQPTMGGEDFAEYQRIVPGCFVWMGTGCPFGWHHPRFVVDESVIPQAATLFAQVAVEALASLQGQGST